MQAPITISLVQCDAVLGDVDRNLDAHLRHIETARRQKADIVAFPELSLTGYGLRDLTGDVAMRADDTRLGALREASRGIDVVAGWIDESPEHVLFNAAGYFSGGRLVHLHRKVYPVNYGMFEERRYWGAGDQLAAFDTRFGRIGLLICEDQWHPSTSYLLFVDRADIVLTISASPARGVLKSAGRPMEPASARVWDGLLRQQSAAFNLFSVYVNRAGVEDGTSFAGGSRVVDPYGEVLLTLGIDEAQETVRLDAQLLTRRRLENPMLRDERLDVTLGNLQRIARERFGH